MNIMYEYSLLLLKNRVIWLKFVY